MTQQRLGGITFDLTGDADDFARQLDAAQQQAQGLTRGVTETEQASERMGETGERATGRVTQGFDSMLDRIRRSVDSIPLIGPLLEGIPTPALVATGAVVGLGGALLGTVNGIRETERELRPMIERSNLSAESLQVLAIAAQRLGSEDGLEGVTDSAQELQLRLSEVVLDGTGPAVAAFERLGLSSQELIRQSPEQAFLATITALQGVTNAADRKFLADELLGGASERLSGLINTQSDDFAELTDRIRENENIVGGPALASARELNITMDELRGSLAQVSTEIGTELLPVFIRVAEFLRDDVVPGFASWIGEVGRLVDNIGDAVTAASDLAAANLGLETSVESNRSGFGRLWDTLTAGEAPITTLNRGLEFLIGNANNATAARLDRAIIEWDIAVVDMSGSVRTANQEMSDLLPTTEELEEQIGDLAQETRDLTRETREAIEAWRQARDTAEDAFVGPQDDAQTLTDLIREQEMEARRLADTQQQAAQGIAGFFQQFFSGFRDRASNALSFVSDVFGAVDDLAADRLALAERFNDQRAALEDRLADRITDINDRLADRVADVQTRRDRQDFLLQRNRDRQLDDIAEQRRRQDERIERDRATTEEDIAERRQRQELIRERQRSRDLENLRSQLSIRQERIATDLEDRLVELARDRQRAIQEAEQDHQDRLRDIAQDAAQRAEDAELDRSRTLEDINRRTARRIEDLDRQLAEELFGSSQADIGALIESGTADPSIIRRRNEEIEIIRQEAARRTEDAAIEHQRTLEDIEINRRQQELEAREQHAIALAEIDQQAIETRQQVEEEARNQSLEAEQAYRETVRARNEEWALEDSDRAEERRLEDLDRDEAWRTEDSDRAEERRLEDLDRDEAWRTEDSDRAEERRLEDLEILENHREQLREAESRHDEALLELQGEYAADRLSAESMLYDELLEIVREQGGAISSELSDLLASARASADAARSAAADAEGAVVRRISRGGRRTPITGDGDTDSGEDLGGGIRRITRPDGFTFTTTLSDEELAALGSMTPFARGGIVTRPVRGLLGEAGPEAVIPLERLNPLRGGGGGLGGTTIQVEILGDNFGIDALNERISEGVVEGLRRGGLSDVINPSTIVF